VPRNLGFLLHKLFGRVEDFARNPHVVADHEHQPRATVVQNQAAGMQLVVYISGGRRRPAADNRFAQRRRDVTGGRPRAQHAGFVVRRDTSGGQDQTQNQQTKRGLTQHDVISGTG
jgi:hypothetical protein